MTVRPGEIESDGKVYKIPRGVSIGATIIAGGPGWEATKVYLTLDHEQMRSQGDYTQAGYFAGLLHYLYGGVEIVWEYE